MISEKLTKKKLKRMDVLQWIPEGIFPKRPFKSIKRRDNKVTFQTFGPQVIQKRGLNLQSFWEFRTITSKTEIGRLTKALRSAKNVQRIYFYCGLYSKFAMKKLHRIVTVLNGPSLRYVTLDLTGYCLDITDETPNVVRRGLQSLKLLKTIVVSFGYASAISDVGLCSLS